MKKIILTNLFLLLAFTHFAQSATYIFKDEDVTPMVEFYLKDMVKLNNAISVYNWSPRPNYVDDSSNQLAYSGAHSFWNGYGSKEGAVSMYGYGLYAAVDPVTSRSFGGGDEGWFLIEMVLPVTFRLIDLGHSSVLARTVPENVKGILKKFTCPILDTPNVFFATGGHSLTQECRDLVREVFDNYLKIDGFAYSYGETQFKDCLSASEVSTSKAFVITKSEWMKPGLVFSYNKNTTQNLDRRIMIQSLFYKAMEAAADISSVRQGIARYLTNNPESNIAASRTTCEGDSCTISVKFCDGQNKCENVDLPKIARPEGPLMSKSSKNKLSTSGVYGTSFSWLWDDLEGKPKAKTVSTWLKANKFGCGNEPYKKN